MAGLAAIALPLVVIQAALVGAAVLGIPAQLPPEARAQQAKVMRGAVRHKELPITNQAVAVALAQLALTLQLQLWAMGALASPRQSQEHQSHAQAVAEEVVVYTALAALAAQVVAGLAALAVARQEPQIQAAEAEVLAVLALLAALEALVLSFFQCQPLTTAA